MRVLLTGGRAPATLDLVRKFKQSGHEVYVAESMKYHLCRYSNAVTKCFTVPSPAQQTSAYIDALSDIIKHYHIDLVLPMCEESLYIAREGKKLQSLTKVNIENSEILNQLHNKFLFNRLIEKTDVAVPKTTLVRSVEEYNALIDQGIITYPHVLKPAYSRFASKAKCVFSPEKITADISAQKPWVAQTYIPGQLICTYSICHEGNVLANAFYANHYTAGKYGTGISFEHYENSQLLKWVTELVKEINYTGQIAFDVILSDDGRFWPIECNPRATSGIHLFSEASNIPDVFLSNKIIGMPMKTDPHPMLSLVMLSYGLSSVRSWNDVKKWFNCFSNGKDVVFRWNDPLPFFTQFLSVFDFVSSSKKNHISIMDAITYDIEWNGKS